MGPTEAVLGRQGQLAIQPVPRLRARAGRTSQNCGGGSEENAACAQDQNEYLARYNGYVERYDAAKAKVEALEQERTLRLARADAFETFIRTVKDMDTVPDEFDHKLWQKTIDTVTVRNDGALVFKF